MNPSSVCNVVCAIPQPPNKYSVLQLFPYQHGSDQILQIL